MSSASTPGLHHGPPGPSHDGRDGRDRGDRHDGAGGGTPSTGPRRARNVRSILAGVTAVLLGTVLVASLVVLAVGRSRLHDARDEVDATWAETRQSLHERYQEVSDLATAVAAQVGDTHEVVADARRAVSDWNARVGTTGTSADDEVLAANAVEGQVRRLLAFVDADPTLAADPTVAGERAAVLARDTTVAVRTFDEAVDALDRTRRSFAGRLARDLVSADERARLELPAT
jgi:hypothetical protein